MQYGWSSSAKATWAIMPRSSAASIAARSYWASSGRRRTRTRLEIGSSAIRPLCGLVDQGGQPVEQPLQAELEDPVQAEVVLLADQPLEHRELPRGQDRVELRFLRLQPFLTVQPGGRLRLRLRFEVDGDPPHVVDQAQVSREHRV